MPTIKEAGDFARMFGVKAVAYGPPGGGKTPAINTAPNAILCITEPGTLSLRGSKVSACEAYTPEAIDDFFTWLASSTEANKYDTVAVDSMSQMAETFVIQELSRSSKAGNSQHGLKAYGEMAKRVMVYARSLYYMKNKHVYLVCKQMMIEDGPLKLKRPYFPGNQLNIEFPGLYDLIMHCALTQHPQHGIINAFRCRETLDILARDRSGKLDELEPLNLGYIFNKIMKG